ncbi:MAG: hypothetical protein ACKODV_00390 [Candidatus Limnocylindrus sp.]
MRFDGGWREWRSAVAAGWTIANAGSPDTAKRAFGSRATSGALARPATPAPARGKKGPALSKEQARRRRAALDADLERLGLRRSQLELSLLDPKVIASYTELARVTSELADVSAALTAAEEAWLALESEVMA